MQSATLLRVNLSTGQIRKEAVPEVIQKNYIGGRGVGSACEDRPCKAVWRARPFGNLHTPRQPHHTACTTL